MPGLATRSAAKHAARIPSSATALASMAPSDSSAMTMARSSGRSPTKIQGASPLWAVFWPAAWWIKSGQPKAATPKSVVRRSRKEEREPKRMAGVSRRSAVPRAAGARRSRRHRFAGPARTSSTVSHSSGARTLATWGAKIGEWQTTWRAGPSVMTCPSARTTARSATRAASSTSWVASTTAWPSPASSRRTR